MLTRSQTWSTKPKTYPNYKMFYTSKHLLASLPVAFIEIEPSCYTKTASDAQWRAAMSQEFAALIDNGNGSIERFKARLVAKGFEQ
jgi:hypothetical protein